jgi:divalent metal cation (Fe/Co/Zn/Cd) transporter
METELTKRIKALSADLASLEAQNDALFKALWALTMDKKGLSPYPNTWLDPFVSVVVEATIFSQASDIALAVNLLRRDAPKR